jgi:hypothetical protein
MGEHGLDMRNLIFSLKTQNFEKNVFFQISTFGIKIWLEGCSLVYSAPLKVFSLRRSVIGKISFFRDPKIGQNRKFAQNPSKKFQNFFSS